jgi:GAF domain-containing protein
MADDLPHTLLHLYGDLGDQIAAHSDVRGALDAITQVAAASVPRAQFASITRRHGDRYQTFGATDSAAVFCDNVQYEVGHGPCIDAVEKDHVFVSGDVATDRRWPVFGPTAAEQAGVHSVLSTRMVLDDEGAMAGLNIYSRDTDAFDEGSRTLALLLATHGAVAVSRAIAREKSANLEVALATSREIGIAMGVLMARHKCTRDQAFDLLRIASQRTHRKLRDLAAEVADIGRLDVG